MNTCISPFTKDGMGFPCGRCYYCLRRRVSGWSFRLRKEEVVSTSSFFITFTYDTDHIRLTPKGYMNLHKPDFQNFMKAIRYKQHGRKKGNIKYFCAAEYGGKSARPHYHAIIYNLKLECLVGKACAKQIRYGNIELDGRTPMFSDSWPHGHITIGTLTEASAGYTLKYVMKPSRIPMHKNDDRQKEFQLISKGLGKSYITPRSKRWHKPQNLMVDEETGEAVRAIVTRFYLPIEDGKKIAMPRYYKDKIYTKLQRVEIGNYIRGQNVDKKDLTGQEEISKLAYSNQKLQKARLDETF